MIEIARETVSDIGSGGEKAKLRTIDSFERANVSLTKIDVEGFEDYVLERVQQMIRGNRPILLLEIHGGTSLATATPEERRKIERTISKIEALNYKGVNIGVHDYMAATSERQNAVHRALKCELVEQQG